MHIIDPKVELITEPDNMKRIELCGRVSYKSEDRITDGSAERFCKMLMSRGHDSPLEHSNICVQIYDWRTFNTIINTIAESITDARPIMLRTDWRNGNMYVSGNVRSWRNLLRTFSTEQEFDTQYIEDFVKGLFLVPEVHKFVEDLKPIFQTIDWSNENPAFHSVDYLTYLSGKKHNIMSMRFTTSRAVSHELVRHRVMSVTQESQRYVDESDLKVIRPSWCDEEAEKYGVWLESNVISENSYSAMLNAGATKQQARDVLTNACKTEVVMTGTIPMWEDFFALRRSPAAYPEMRLVADMACDIYSEVQEKTNNWEVPYVG